MGLKEAFANMSDDFKKKLAAVKSNEDFKKLLDEEKVELTKEQVEALAAADAGAFRKKVAPPIAIGIFGAAATSTAGNACKNRDAG